VHAQGVHVVSTDEKTGIQALERIHPNHPPAPGKVELVEFEYERHGTQALIADFEVATGQVISPTIKDTRTEHDFAEPIRQTVATDPQSEWNIHHRPTQYAQIRTPGQVGRRTGRATRRLGCEGHDRDTAHDGFASGFFAG
jgi:DDE superfamily endonuclease